MNNISFALTMLFCVTSLLQLQHGATNAEPVPIAQVEHIEQVREQDAAKSQAGTMPEPSPETSVAFDVDILEQAENVSNANILDDDQPEPVPVIAEGTDERTGQRVQAQVWGVPIEGNRVATVAHLVQGIRVTQVTVNGRQSRLARHQDHSIDFAVAAYESPRAARVRNPKYMERVYVRAMKTGKTMCGLVTCTAPMWTVSLEADEDGIQVGDSGSPVYAESGELIGVLHGMHGNRSQGTLNPRVVRFEPVVFLNVSTTAPVQSSQAGVTPSPQSPAQGAPTNCVDGQCRQQPVYQYQRQRTYYRWR